MSLCVSDDCLRRKIWFYQLSTIMPINMAKFREFQTVIYSSLVSLRKRDWWYYVL